ncbi:hypothetical protein KI387_005691 [Taxus chinensis]|uniref:Uncharacterized protein n=1 Tax=Taxus chinensis TaxID=29808 RepID=A0AA38GNR6_TAXCH|nr:hypothetical protein KI387_005691 [Taxus chinensis]
MQATGLPRFSSTSSASLILHLSSKFSPRSLRKIKCNSASSNVEVAGADDNKLLSGRERRKQRNERRAESIRSKIPWRDAVEESLSRKTKKPTLWQQMDLDTLAAEGVRWWALWVRKTSESSAAKDLFTEFRRQYPHAEFEIFVPEKPSRKKLKNGSYSKSKEMALPGCLFIRCLLNKEIHDFIRSSPGVRGFSGTKFGNSLRWIMRPAPVRNIEMEKMLKRFEEEQENYNCEIEDRVPKEKRNKTKDDLVRRGILEDIEHGDFSTLKNANPRTDSANKLSNININGKQIGSFDSKFNSKKPSRVFADSASTHSANEPSFKGPRKQKDNNKRDRLPRKQDSKLLAGSTVKVISGPFAEFTGRIKEFDSETGKAKVTVTMFGNETPLDLDINQLEYEA